MAFDTRHPRAYLCFHEEAHATADACRTYEERHAYSCMGCRFFCATAEELHVHLGGDAHEKRIAAAKEST